MQKYHLENASMFWIHHSDRYFQTGIARAVLHYGYYRTEIDVGLADQL